MFDTTLQKYQDIWKNLTVERIDEIGELMAELYTSIIQNPIFTSSSDRQTKRQEMLDRFANLGIFMADSGAIDVISEQNKAFYSFIDKQFYANPFLPSPEEYKKAYCMDPSKSYIELKAETIDCENKIAKMCMAQMGNIIQTNIPKVYEGTRRDRIVHERYNFYVELYNALRRSTIEGIKQKEPNAEKWFSHLYNQDGTFDMDGFIETAQNVHTQEGIEEFLFTYGHLVGFIVQTNPKLQVHIKKYDTEETRQDHKMQYSLTDVAKFSIAKSLAEKLYEYKFLDLRDLLMEYDVITGTKEKDKVLITHCEGSDKEVVQKNMGVDIYIQGYTQPFRIHMPRKIYEALENRYGKIPARPEGLNPPGIKRTESIERVEEGISIYTTSKSRSIFTRKFSQEQLQNLDKIDIEETTGIVRTYIEYAKKIQQISTHRRKIKTKKAKEVSQVKAEIAIILSQETKEYKRTKQRQIKSINDGIAKISLATDTLSKLNKKLSELKLKLAELEEKELI